MTYTTRHVKRNPETGEVALRTIFDQSENPQQAMMEWLVSSPATGPRHTWTLEVDGWDDLYVPEPVEPPPPPPYPEQSSSSS